MRKFITLVLAALVIGTVSSLVPAPAFAGQYSRDNVFRPGELRWGGDSRYWEDRNVRPRHNGRHDGRRGHMGSRQVQPKTWSRTTTRRVYLGTQVVPLGTLYVPRNGGKSIFVPVQ